MLSHFEEKKVLCSGAAYVNGGVNAFMQIICTYIMGLYIMRDACASVMNVKN